MATKARVHWFWRGAIAVLLGAIANAVILRIGAFATALFEQYSLGAAITVLSVIFLPALPSLAVYIYLSDLLGSPPSIGPRLRNLTVPCAMTCNIFIFALARQWVTNPYHMILVFSVLTSVAPLGIYRLVCYFAGRYLQKRRCRRCHHILRGLSEPRCPECGEAI